MIRFSAMSAPEGMEVTPLVTTLVGPLPEVAARAAALGFDGFEVMVGKGDGPRLDPTALRHALEQHHVALAAVNTGRAAWEDGIVLLTEDRRVRDQAMDFVHTCIDFAAPFGVPALLGAIRGYPLRAGVSRQWAEDLAVDLFKELAQEAANKGVRLLLEPIANESDLITTTEEGLAIVDRVGNPAFGLMLDLAQLCSMEDDMYAAMRSAGQRAEHYHFYDANRWPPREGSHLDFPAIVGVLKEVGFSGFVTFGLAPKGDKDTMARHSLAYLRGLAEGQQE